MPSTTKKLSKISWIHEKKNMENGNWNTNDSRLPLQQTSSDSSTPTAQTTHGMPLLSDLLKMSVERDGGLLKSSCLTEIEHNWLSILKNKSSCPVDVIYTTQGGRPNTSIIVISLEQKKTHEKSGVI
jgi:hypothetical protein